MPTKRINPRRRVVNKKHRVRTGVINAGRVNPNLINPDLFKPIGAIKGNVKASIEASPLLLMPMRLEYRVVDNTEQLDMVDSGADTQKIKNVLAMGQGNSIKVKKARESAKNEMASELRNQPIKKSRLPHRRKSEIWFRWYTDEAFTTKGIVPADDQEKALINHFLSRIGRHNWWDTSVEEVASGWQSLASTLGPQRAVHLLRSIAERQPDKQDQKSWELNIGRIAALPHTVELFAVKGEVIQSIGLGNKIEQNTGSVRSKVSYTYDAIDLGGWLSDFDTAIESGMGLKLSDHKTVNVALNADWIIAVGLHSKDAKAEVESLLKDRIANGEFEFLPQDTPTNNSAGERTVHSDPKLDSLAYLNKATDYERGDVNKRAHSAAGLLSEALGLEGGSLDHAVRAGDTAYEDAKAMLQLIGPALLDDDANGKTFLSGVDENKFIEVLASSIVARGVFSPIRSGRNAYGITAMTDVKKLRFVNSGDNGAHAINNFIQSASSIIRHFAPYHADEVVPILEPDDAYATDKLDAILKSNRVSVRLDVTDEGSDNTRAIGCPYVSGSRRRQRPEVYLKELRTLALNRLPDPTSQDRVWPLLYRLLRISLTRNSLLTLSKVKHGSNVKSLRDLETIKAKDKRAMMRDYGTIMGKSASAIAELRPNRSHRIPKQTLSSLRKANKTFSSALRHLETIAARPGGNAQLEILMMEVVDLFQHRVDAWATGLAYSRLKEKRDTGQEGLSAGYFGFIGKLRRTSVSGSSDGYIQAPSMAQATTAAVLRSAYLRQRENGAFAINLRSNRARRALALLDLLKKGLTVGEALGLRGERFLHDLNKSSLIPFIRERFPVVNMNSSAESEGKESPAGRRVFDGLAFLESVISSLAVGENRKPLLSLRKQLYNDFDALSDLVMAEAVHQRAQGAVSAASAWLQVLSGGHIPGEPVFLKCQRHGQGSSHRVSMMLEETEITENDSLRAVAEPAIAALAQQALSGFDSANINVQVSSLDNPEGALSVVMNLRSDLGISPIDLVIGGKSEIDIRLQNRLLESWLRNPAMGDHLGLTLERFFSNELNIEFDFSVGSTSVASLLDKADLLRGVIQKGRAIEPADINAAALPEHTLTEQTEVQTIAGAVVKLRHRANTMLNRLSHDINQLTVCRRQFVQTIDVASELLKSGVHDSEIGLALNRAELKRRALTDILTHASSWSEPSALRPILLQEAISDTGQIEEHLIELERRLAKRRSKLMSALSETSSSAAQAVSDARKALNTLVSAISGALDGDALKILPPYPRDNALNPELSGASSVKGTLKDWAAVRGLISKASALLDLLPSMQAFSVSDAATGADDISEDADQRSEKEAPRSRHFGVMIGEEFTVKRSATALGFVVDEWSEQRPADHQAAALAINYDTPQAESPHCLLLCVPPDDSLKRWTPQNASNMVFEAISWMKIRALPTTDKVTPAALLPQANQVAYKKMGAKSLSRIPKQRFSFPSKAWFESDASFVVRDKTGTAPEAVHQRNGFFRIKEQ
ncbi:hypothetical protein [Alkalimarinus alittae]|uniref:Uncharacterized protein n=1 Tax=Alkalimarinus alittae TaxID=2961619 RepID=A0ABY6N653_9ALTE|nr:hypothetical protein [Alkalimarinus alittae]UZE97472.1 hypothetical protein NKI27_06935 [Alkalimarinus alittae]